MKYCAQCPNGYPDSLFACPTHGGVLHEIRELKPGMVIHKAYRIVRKLGQGGMGIVYLADHIYMQEQRALKFLSWELCQDEAFTSRFRQEVRTLQRIHHRNVVDCGDLEPAEDDSLFFPMEFVDGPDLFDFMRASPILLDVELALSLSIAIAEGLSAAHALGLVHRDIKPENVLLAQSGDEWIPKIADFGIVAIKESGNTRTRTKTGASLLTMEYAAPEQWRGVRAGDLDGRTDIYALGGVMYEMLTGKPTFEAESYEGWAECHKNSIPERPSDRRPELAEWPGLDELVLQMLAKERDQRPANTAEVLRRLREIQHVEPGSVPANIPNGRPGHRSETLFEIPQGPFVPLPPPGKSTTGPREPQAPPPIVPGGPPPLPPNYGGGFVAPLPDAGGASGHAGTGHAGSNPGGSSLTGANPGGSFSGGVYPADRTSSQGGGLISNAGGFGSGAGSSGSGTVPPKPGKWLPLAIAALVLFAVGGFIYYNHVAKKPVDPHADNITPPPPPDQPVIPAQRPPEVTPEKKLPYVPTPSAPAETIAEKVDRGQALFKNKRYSEAAPLFQEGCNGDNAFACNQLGYLYEDGLGVPKTPSRSITLYGKGCDLDNVVACFNLGAMYVQATGVKQDYAKGAMYYTKACDGGQAGACNGLGVMYQSAQGVTRNDAKAVTFFVKGCDGGNAAACSNLGQAYVDGAGIGLDVDKGKEYLNKGCSMGDQWGCDKLKVLK